MFCRCVSMNPALNRTARLMLIAVRGVASLHSFSCEDAIDAFRAALKIDPNFAMAFWGEAVSFSQPLWFFEEPAKARAALAKLAPTPDLRLEKAATARERGFLRAVEALFGPGDPAASAAAYAQAMAKVATENPADDEAQTFYALALLGRRAAQRPWLDAGALHHRKRALARDERAVHVRQHRGCLRSA